MHGSSGKSDASAVSTFATTRVLGGCIVKRRTLKASRLIGENEDVTLYVFEFKG
ncbi:MAG: hypothetical protein ACKESB_03295 [Candidatus Hodgkinia cicadicola]